MTTTDPLIPFITARLDEDEATARAASRDSGHRWVLSAGDVAAQVGALIVRTLLLLDHGNHIPPTVSAHVVRHDPEHVLQRLGVTRAVLDAYRDFVQEEGVPHPADFSYEGAYGRALTLQRILALTAGAWSTHPDYDPAWAQEEV